MSDGQSAEKARSWRLWLVLVLLCLIATAITAKLLSLYLQDQQFLQGQGDARSLRTIQVPAHRGMITDRNGAPLAVSAPVATIWADPQESDLKHTALGRLATLLEIDRKELVRKLADNRERRFIYLKRQVTPELAEKVRQLGIPGIHVDREYKRYYPAAEVATHLVGFTNLDGRGQEGLELAFQDSLQAHNGRQLVLKDRIGRTIKHIREVAPAQNGRSLQLTIDLRLQYLAYRELKAAVQAHHADGGSLVMLDASTGEILAMVNQPSYNPNDPQQRVSNALRNRALTDTFEPGSTMKPLTVTAALMSGKYTARSVVDTSPGYMKVRRHTLRDHRNYGELDITGIITKSSNVGVSKLALSLEAGAVRNLMANVGLGQVTGTGFPGEQGGHLPFLSEAQDVQRATLSYGYGLAVTPLQLAQAYLPLANDGMLAPVSLLRDAEQGARPVRVIQPGIARQVRTMMETVISAAGTGKQAAVQGYKAAGKTGTVHKVGASGYLDDQYISIFAGMAPADNPKLVTAVMIDNPRVREYYGGEVAAPVFSRTMAGALRMMNVAPDTVIQEQQRVAQQ